MPTPGPPSITTLAVTPSPSPHSCSAPHLCTAAAPATLPQLLRALQWLQEPLRLRDCCRHSGDTGREMLGSRLQTHGAYNVFIKIEIPITYLDLDELTLLFLDLKESPLLITFFPDVEKFL